VQKDCQARNLNREDAMDHTRSKMDEADKDWMIIRTVGGWVYVSSDTGSPG